MNTVVTAVGILPILCIPVKMTFQLSRVTSQT